MDLKKYWILTSLATFILLPVLLIGGLILLGMLFANGSHWPLPLKLSLVVLHFFAVAYIVYRFGKKATLPDTFLSRYGPFVAPILCILLGWLLIASIAFINEDYSSVLIFSEALWLIPALPIVVYLFFTACFAVGTWRSKRFVTLENKKAFYVLASFLVLTFVSIAQGYVQYHSVLHPNSKHPVLWDNPLGLKNIYAPFSENTRLVSPKTPPSLQIDRDYPKLDGAVALIPIYAAAANAVYRGNEADKTARKKAVGLSVTTPAAYKALIDGNADIIFALAPSEEQVKEAAEEGITYTLTPIAREAFVFLVNESNPVTNLSIEQIRGIYSGKINNWREVGGAPGKILAFQRNEGSGSQTAMLRNVMRETPMRKPLEVEYYEDMSGIIREVADYRNQDHAIGYSFRFYATVMHSIPGLRLLAIDNIAPSVENIRNGAYPFTDDFYMVTARPLSENAQKLHDWFLSDEGQQLIEEVGYVPLRNDSR
ncbi:MAG: PstS family phosphate ABC transporter substrate-binding protein [Betaproteobacteria bacterium]|nr:PstS family phosphate ABC transporter substrate-binding protein [Betaproteobacteria bacterium]